MHFALTAAFFLCTSACSEKSSTPKKPPNTATPIVTTTASVADAASASPVSTRGTDRKEPRFPESGTRWFLAASGVTPVAVLTFEPGKVGTVEIVSTGKEAEALKKIIPTLSAPDGFHEKMHVGGKNGERGGLSLVHFPPSHKRYISVFCSKVEQARVNVDQIGRSIAPPITGKVQKLVVSHKGTTAGSIDFSSSPPVLSAEDPDGMLATYWKQAQEMKELKVFYITERGTPSLATQKAAPGDPTYGDVVRVWLHDATTFGNKSRFKVVAEVK